MSDKRVGDRRVRISNLHLLPTAIGPGVLVFVTLLAVYLVTASGRIDSGDGLTIFAVSQSLLEDGDVAIAPPDPELTTFDAQGRPLGKTADLGIEDGYSIRGREGHTYSSYGIGHSLLLLPLLALGRLVGLVIRFASTEWAMQFVASLLFNPLVSAASGWLVYQAGRRLCFTSATSIALAIVYAFGTMTWVYAKSSFSDPLIGLLLLLAFYSVLSFRYDPRRLWLWIGGVSLGFAVLTKPTSLINVPILIAYLIVVTRAECGRVSWKYLWTFAIPIGVGVAGMLAYNWWRFGSPLDTGYRNVSWTFPWLKGMYGLIASPGKGYLLYNPISLAAIVGALSFGRQHKAELWFIIGIIVAQIVFLAPYDHWHGGGCWGPRLLLPITPLLILPLGSLLENLARQRVSNFLLATLVAISVIVQVPGVVVSYARFLQRVYDLSVDQYYQRVTFEIAYSPLLGQWGEMREVIGNLRDPARRSAIRQAALGNGTVVPEKNTTAVLAANLPDFWFVYLGFLTAAPAP